MDIFRWNDKPINSSAKTYIVIHGYLSNGREDWVEEIESDLAKKDPSANVLALNWKDDASGIYGTAANNSEKVGKQLAHYLKEQGINPANVEVIGHSLGAHVAAYASEKFYKITQQGYFTKKEVRKGFGFKICVQEKCSEQGFGKIVALDPAGVKKGTNLVESPLFHRRSHAKRVVAIHTDYTLGTDQNVGDLDLHVRRIRPEVSHSGSLLPFADHSYAHEMFRKLQKGETFSRPGASPLKLEVLDEDKGTFNMFSPDPLGGISANTPLGPMPTETISIFNMFFHVQGNENTASQLDNGDPIENPSYADNLNKTSRQGKNIESVHTSSSNLDAVSNQNSAVDITTTNNVNHPIPFAEVLQNSDLFVATTMASNSDLTQTPNTTILSGIGGFEPLVPVCELPMPNYDPLVGQAKGINYPIPSTEVFQDSDIFGADSMVDNSDLNQNPSNAFQSINFGEVAANLPLGGDICQHDNLVEPITMGSWSQSSGSSFDLNTLGNVQSFNNIVSTQTGLNFVNAEQHSFA